MVVSVARDGGQAARKALERCIGDGGVVAFPADTLYGLACDPLRRDAVERIHALKGRDDGKPSAVMFFAPLAMREILSALGPRTREALGALLPGPVTAGRGQPRAPLPARLPGGPGAPRAAADRRPARRSSLRALPDQRQSQRRAGAEPLRGRGPRHPRRRDLAIDGGELGGEPSTVVDLTALDDGGTWEVLRDGALEPRRTQRAPPRHRVSIYGCYSGPECTLTIRALPSMPVRSRLRVAAADRAASIACSTVG